MPDIAKINGTAYASIAKVNSVAWLSMGALNGITNPDISPTLPTGLIIPYTAGAGGAPSGWSLYASANDKFIIGAGSTYSVDANGLGTGEVTKTIPSSGTHTGTLGNATGDSGRSGNNAGGAHSHLFSFTYAPLYQDIYLIKADAGQTTLPQYGCIFSHQDDLSNGGSNIYTTAARMLKANSGVTAGGSLTPSGTTTSSGSHNHGTSSGGGDTGLYEVFKMQSSGAHTHATSVTMTSSLERYKLSCWSNTAGTMTLEVGTLALYENVIPPADWALCDGNNGTPDMTDKFLEFCAGGAEGDRSGDGTVTATGTIETHGTHNHKDRDDRTTSLETAYHIADTAHANHSAMSENYTWLPPYYALAWIMYTG